MTGGFLTVERPHSEQLVVERSRFIAYIENATGAAAAQMFVDKISKRHFDATHNCFAYSLSGGIAGGGAGAGNTSADGNANTVGAGNTGAGSINNTGGESASKINNTGGASATANAAASIDGTSINAAAPLASLAAAPAQKFSDAGEPSGTAGLPILEAIKSKGLSNVCIVVTRYFGGVKLGASGLTRAYGKAARGVIEGAKIVRFTLCDLLEIKTAYTFLNSLNFLLEKKYKCKINQIIYGSDITVLASVPVDDTERVIKEINNITAGGCAAVVIDKNYYKLGESL
jgi:putative IMPACT (imprinted ancient) family translation regulator